MIKKAVFPVAGLGTRFLPATKASPKEMMPIVDTPLIQYAVNEAIEAGVEELIFVTSSSKRAIEDHFDSHFELETRLKLAGKNDLLAMVKNILPDHVSCVYIRQPEALGLGHAILCAKQVIGNEPFAILLADDLMMEDEKEGASLKQMVKAFNTVKNSVVAVETVPLEDTHKYGIVGVQNDFNTLGLVNTIVEKPNPVDAPSRLAVVGRYILTPAIFELLEQVVPGKNGEIQLTDAISALLTKESVYAFSFKGERFDCGDKLGYLKAVVSYGLKHPETAEAFKAYLSNF